MTFSIYDLRLSFVEKDEILQRSANDYKQISSLKLELIFRLTFIIKIQLLQVTSGFAPNLRAWPSVSATRSTRARRRDPRSRTLSKDNFKKRTKSKNQIVLHLHSFPLSRWMKFLWKIIILLFLCEACRLWKKLFPLFKLSFGFIYSSEI